jgi:hypothetical protein
MLPVSTAVISMPAVKQVQERAKQQQDVRQRTKQMRFVFFPKEKDCYRSKSKKHKPASRAQPADETRLLRRHIFSSYSTISFPRNIPIWHANSYSPASLGINSTGTVSPSGSLALLLKAGSSTISLHDADSWRTKFKRTGFPRSTTITSGV